MTQAPLDALKERVALLLRRQAQLQSENKRLQARLSEQEAHSAQLQTELLSAGKQLLTLGIAATVPTPEEKQRLRAELDKIITEIDTILTSLHD